MPSARSWSCGTEGLVSEMPTKEERREIAARLRETAGQIVFTGEGVEDCIFDNWWSYSAADGAKSYMRLADLIEPEERTCRLTYDTVHDDMVCSSCGAWLDMVAYSELETSGQMRYCPVCGAKVVDDHA